MHGPRTWRKGAGLLAAAGLALTACGGGGSSALSGDDLASELDTICRTATRAIGKLDPADGAGYYSDAADLLDDASGDLGKLKVGERDAGDVEDFASLVDDEVKALQDVADAADAGDSAALATAQADLAGKSADADEIANDLDAEKCVGLGVAALDSAVVPPTVTTVAETTTTVAETTTTVPVTTLPVTLPTTIPVTLPPTPVTTLPDVTTPTPSGSIVTGNMIDTWTAPPGFRFDQEMGDIWAAIIFAPESVASLAPAIVAYEGGAIYSDAGDFISMAALELTSDFTDDQISDWVDYEGSGNGDVQTTPGGLSVWVEPPTADNDYSLYLWIIGKYGMYATVSGGVDGLGFVDAFTSANFE